MKVITNSEARKGKNTIYRQILAASLKAIREIGPVPFGDTRYYCACYCTSSDLAIGRVVFDRSVGKWTHAESPFYTCTNEEIEFHNIMLY